MQADTSDIVRPAAEPIVHAASTCRFEVVLRIEMFQGGMDSHQKMDMIGFSAKCD